jgi:hypothetical protein
MSHTEYCTRIADSYPRICPECKCSLDDGHYDPHHDICSIAERAWSEMADTREDYR